MVQFKDIASENFPIPESEGDKYMKIVLPIDEGSELIGNDVPSFMGKTNERENRSKIAITIDDKDIGAKIFFGLSEGGEVEVPYENDGKGNYFAMFRDKYGIEWAIEYSQDQ